MKDAGAGADQWTHFRLPVCWVAAAGSCWTLLWYRYRYVFALHHQTACQNARPAYYKTWARPQWVRFIQALEYSSLTAEWKMAATCCHAYFALCLLLWQIYDQSCWQSGCEEANKSMLGAIAARQRARVLGFNAASMPNPQSNIDFLQHTIELTAAVLSLSFYHVVLINWT